MRTTAANGYGSRADIESRSSRRTARSTLGVETAPDAIEKSSTKPSMIPAESSRKTLRSTVMPSGVYAHPRLTRKAVSVPVRRNGVMMCTPGAPFRVRVVTTNSFAKSYVPVVVTRRNRTVEFRGRCSSGTGASASRASTWAFCARRARKRSSCQNPSRMQPNDTARENSVKKTIRVRTP